MILFLCIVYLVNEFMSETLLNYVVIKYLLKKSLQNKVCRISGGKNIFDDSLSLRQSLYN